MLFIKVKLNLQKSSAYVLVGNQIPILFLPSEINILSHPSGWAWW